MTRRIVIAILLSVALVLLLSDLLGYWAIRSVLLEDLDQTILARINTLPQLGSESTASVAKDPNDRYVIENDLGQNLALPAGFSQQAQARRTVLRKDFTTVADGSRYRTLTVKTIAWNPQTKADSIPVTVVYSASAAHFDQLLARLLGSLLVVNVLVASAAALVARWSSASALKPLKNTAEIIGTIDERHLDRRIEVDKLPTELVPVAERLNEMVARLQGSFDRRRQFIADASHELRGPVAALLTTLEVCAKRPRDSEEYQRVLVDCLTNAQVLRSLVQSLMDQVKSERFGQEVAREPASPNEIIQQCAVVANALAAPLNVQVSIHADPLPCIETAPHLLRSVIMNVLTNAVEYNRPGGRVTLTASYAGSQLSISVADTGKGIPADDLPRIGNPFFRVDRVRTLTSAHHMGLGMFLVQTHLQTLGGTISIQSTLGEGTTVQMSIPAPTVAPVDPASHAVST
ncbi:MAG: sensor histidine kinase [Phycisphaerae bacterium]